MSAAPFLPMSRKEMDQLNWDELDILLITGDCYVDHPSFGTTIIGRYLESLGYKVGIVAQPNWNDPEALKVMGTPKIGIGVSSGNMDSMINIYTAGRRLRREDMFSENGVTGKRPPHALPVYAQLARRAFPGKPVLIGGLEASLRRVAHYDYWQDKIRPSMLVDSKSDILIYGMGERPTPEAFKRMQNGESLAGIRGTARLLGKKAALEFDRSGYVELPSYEEILADRDALMQETKLVEANMNYYSASGLIQQYGDRLLVIEPPAEPLTPHELDRVHELPYARKPHPSYKGRIPAYDAIADSIQAVRGCPGGCAFCGLVAHQGRTVMSRSEESIVKEAEIISSRPEFKGTISDVGGAAGNLFGSAYDIENCKKCRRVSCLFPAPCKSYRCDGQAVVHLLRTLRKMPKIRHLYINSGIRLDLALRQKELLYELIAHHVSGHMKVAPEHLHPRVMKLMRKGTPEEFYEFMREFERISKECGLEQYIIPLFISNFPGCTDKEMKTVDDFLNKHHWSLQQVQDYIPLPMTMGAAMYYTGKDASGNPIEVNRGLAERRAQIHVLKKRRSPVRKNKKRPPRQ
ncbi:MAG: YgiQ family radical SAM protein [Lentisphaeria bacterium]|nr:YgiQ family radical SAM protein [Lentisphaeria bacterium]